MDLSKAERQSPNDGRRADSPDYLRTLLQDLLCFFILLSVALLIVAGILFVVEDMSRLQQQPRRGPAQYPTTNDSQVAAGALEEPSKMPGRRCFNPYKWIRFFNCHKRVEVGQEAEQPQLQGQGEETKKDKKLEQQQQAVEGPAPTYGPAVDPLHRQAAGDHLDPAAANKYKRRNPHIDPELQHLADPFYSVEKR
ncbi:uncharacterized protein [Drosophila bipectinata]|uniref:uncharacterized protein n=1 Tax=Drosophila bipectinata TaxID=42026 RepID=UPI001C88ED7E|nr:uncharacterized protein LOC108130364 [Drosophila bipectinata]